MGGTLFFYYFSKEFSMSEEFEKELSKKITYATQNEDCVVIHYQSIHNNRTEKIEKYEVLMRLNVDGEILYPNDFLPLSKKDDSYFEHKDMEFSINLSIIDIEDDNFNRIFFKKMNQYNIYDKLTIEIVETEKISRSLHFHNFIKRVKLLNCKVAVDDFGTGYSNIEYILDMSEYIDYIKFDGSLIKKIVENPKVQLFVGNLKYLCDNIEVLTVAEYVENKEILEYVDSLGIDYSQGYHIGKPQSHLKCVGQYFTNLSSNLLFKHRIIYFYCIDISIYFKFI